MSPGYLLLVFVVMMLTAVGGIAQHRYYTRTAGRLAREHDEPGTVLVSGRGKGRLRGADRRARAPQGRRDDPGGVGHGGRHRAGPLQGPPRLGRVLRAGPAARVLTAGGQAVADARTRIPGRRRLAPASGSRFRRP